MTKLDPAFSIDWLRVSYPTNVTLQQIAPKLDGFEYQGEVTPLKNYNQGHDYKCCRVDMNTTNPEQGHLLTMTGAHLRALRPYRVQELDLLRSVLNVPGAKLTRLDLAVDCINAMANPWEIVNRFKSKEIRTKARQYSIVYGANDGGCTGLTVYLGSRSSQMFLRAYDKGREQGADFPWTRLEMELKADTARAVGDAILQHGLIDVTKNTIKRFVSGVDWIDEITFGTRGRLVQQVQRKITDHEKWIRDVALPCVLKAYALRQPEVVEAFRGLDFGEIAKPTEFFD